MSSDGKNVLAQISAFYKSPLIKIFFSENCLKIGQSNKLKPRLFIISSVGLHLIRRKSILRSPKMVRFISFYDLESIHVAGYNISFSNFSNSIRIKVDNKQDTILRYVYCLRKALFDPNVYGINIQYIDEEKKNNFLNSCSDCNFEFDDLEMSKFMVFLSREDNHNILNNDLFAVYQKMIKECGNEFVINNTLMDSQLLNPVLLMLAFSKKVQVLVLKGIKFILFLENAKRIFELNNSIRKIVFDNVDFTESRPLFVKLFNGDNQFEPKEWCFLNCNLNNQFEIFFDSFSNLNTYISDLAFNNCIYEQNSISFIFQSILFNKSLHKLSSFKIDGVNENNELQHYINELICSEWALQTKCFKSLSFCNCKIDITKVFESLLLYCGGLRKISLSGNDFLKPIEFNKTKLKKIEFLDLSNVHFTIDSLISLYKVRKFKNHRN